MYIRIFGALASLGLCVLNLSCSQSALEEKISALKADGSLDCADLKNFTDFVLENKDQRGFRRFLQGEGANEPAIKEFFKSQGDQVTLSFENCSGPTKNTHFSVYLENSASMDGYVRGVSNFESVLSNLVIGLNYHYDPKQVNFNFINSEIYPVEIGEIDQFFSSLEPGVAPFKVGNQFVSELNQTFEKVLSKLAGDEVSIFVSDCIYSLEKGRSSQEGLIYEESLTKNAFLQRLKKADFSTYILQFNSGFSGTYYASDNAKQTLSNAHRPYYIWIMGNDQAVQELISKVKVQELAGYQNSYYLAGAKRQQPSSQYLSSTNLIGRTFYRGNEPTSLKEIEFVNGAFQFSIAVDLSIYPQNKSLTDLLNYQLSPGTTLVDVKEIPNNNQPALIKPNDWQKIKDKPYTHLMTIQVSQKEFPSFVQIAYKNTIPTWVKNASTQDDSNIKDNLDQTFGLQQLVRGVYDAYKMHHSNNDTLFEIKYNLSK